MLKFETTANIGDTIKAFDFEPCEGRADKFLQGVVLEKGWVGATEQDRFLAYTVGVTDSHKESRIGEVMYVPFEVDFDDFDNRVTKL
jgi:hypothetical protein